MRPSAPATSLALSPLLCVALLALAGLQGCGNGSGAEPNGGANSSDAPASRGADPKPAPTSDPDDGTIFEPDTVGYVRWTTHCPFPYSLRHPKGWSPRPAEGASFRSLEIGTERFLKLWIAGTGGVGAMRPTMQSFRSQNLQLATIRVSGKEIDVFGADPEGLSNGNSYILFPPLDREDEGGLDLRAQLQVTVDGIPVLPRDSILSVLSTLSPNGC